MSSQLLLRRLLEQAGGAQETGYVLVLDGDGLGELPDQIPTGSGRYGVRRVGTEVGLRHLLWQAKGAPIIAVVPEYLARRLPPDLLRRAANQRVHALAVNDILEVVLGVRVVGAEAPHLQELALEHMDALGLALSRRTLPTVIDWKLLTELLLDASVGERVRTMTPGDLLAGWLDGAPKWSPNVVRLVREALPTMHGDQGRLLAWALGESGRPRDLLVHGALLTVDDDDPPQKVWGPLWKAAASPPIEMDRRIVRRAARQLAEDALATLGEAAGPMLAEADRRGRELLPAKVLQTSKVLPLAFADRCHTLAVGAADGKVISAADVAWVARHRAAPMNRAQVAVIAALSRLTRFLNQPPASPSDVAEQVVAYQRDGAFADVAVLQLRRALAASSRHHVEATKVLDSVRSRRDEANRRFAESLAKGYEAAFHHKDVTPLHRLWKRVVAESLADPASRIYLIVLDGCSYPVFLELLYELAQDNALPLGITPDREGHVAGMPALAPLPTVTSHARGAIFLGQLPNDPLVAESVFRDQDEAKTDKARFKQNAALGSRSRKLFLKGDLADHGAGLLAALRDDTIDVVAVVFNAVDDLIGSSNTGAVTQLKPETIVAFKPSLEAAVRSGRRVLLTADHGHSPYVDKSLRAGAGSTPRYLPLGPDEKPPEGFICIDLAGLGGPPERRAFAWQSGAYLGSPQVGFHGGCSLEEMVVPLAWIEPNGLQADEPSWWHGEGALPEEEPVRVMAPPVVTPLPMEPKSKKQYELFDPATRADSLPLPAEVLAVLSHDQKAILVLLEDNGSARAGELAERLGKNPVRLNGLMRTLRRTLHKSGFVLFTDSVLPSGETQYQYQPPESKR